MATFHGHSRRSRAAHKPTNKWRCKANCTCGQQYGLMSVIKAGLSVATSSGPQPARLQRRSDRAAARACKRPSCQRAPVFCVKRRAGAACTRQQGGRDCSWMCALLLYHRRHSCGCSLGALGCWILDRRFQLPSTVSPAHLARLAAAPSSPSAGSSTCGAGGEGGPGR